jgi:hypothetical protein
MLESTEAVAPLDLRDVGWQLVTEVSEQSFGPISRTPEDGADGLSRNVGTKLPLLSA